MKFKFSVETEWDIPACDCCEPTSFFYYRCLSHPELEGILSDILDVYFVCIEHVTGMRFQLPYYSDLVYEECLELLEIEAEKHNIEIEFE